MQLPSRWLAHTPMTEPAALESQIKNLPSDVASLNRVVQGLLVHAEWLAAYGLEPLSFDSPRPTLPVHERLGALVACDGPALEAARPPARRAVGTCRDFALALCSFLRANSVPARLSCASSLAPSCRRCPKTIPAICPRLG